MTKFQPMQRVRLLFNRSEKRKSRSTMNKSSCIVPLIKTNTDEGIFNLNVEEDMVDESLKSRKMSRSHPNQRHLNEDGSSLEQLKTLCKKINDLSKTEESQPTIKGDYSSGKELQMADEERLGKGSTSFDHNNNNDHMNEKQLSALDYDATQTNSNGNILPVVKKDMQNEQKINEDEDEAFSHTSHKIRYEMMDQNEQAKLLLNKRKKKKKPSHKRRSSEIDRKRSEMILKSYSNMIPAFEVKRNSMRSMSSCSIDSALDDKNDLDSFTTTEHSKESTSKYYESFSCQAKQISEDLKAVLADSYGIASSWFCINLQVDDLKYT